MNLQIESSANDRIQNFSRANRQILSVDNPTMRYSSPMLALNTDGFIQECGESIQTIFGYRQHELIWQHISRLFPHFSDVALMRGDRLNPMLSYLCHCDHVFEAINKQGEVVICNLNFFLVENKGVPNLRMIVRPVANDA